MFEVQNPYELHLDKHLTASAEKQEEFANNI